MEDALTMRAGPRPGEPDRSGYPPIEAHAILGDARSAALVALDGTIDWLCWPRFDSASLFGSLLDTERGGRFRVGPAQPARVSRRYVGPTNVLETTFETETGTWRLTDFMPAASEEQKGRALSPEHMILRIIDGIQGVADVELDYDPRPEYGADLPTLRDRGPLGLACGEHGWLLNLRTDLEARIRGDRPGAGGRTRVRAGERRYCALTYAHDSPAILPPLGDYADEVLETTLRWWRDWAGSIRYDGHHREAVVRSALALKLLTYAPSGALVAAATSSLPERLRGGFNWDYRYCWLRDASLSIRAFWDLGLREEAESFLLWTQYATRLTWPQLQILYDVYGRTDLDERELRHLRGYEDSRPVRVGNGAIRQFQLDIYGEMAQASYDAVRRRGRLGRHEAKMLRGLGETVMRRWREPDDGIWEDRRERRHHTLSKVMAWVTLDRLIRLHDDFGIDVPIARLRQERQAIRDTVERHGWNEELQSYTATLDGDGPDASLNLLVLFGYDEPNAPRLRATTERIRERLGAGPLLYRDPEDRDRRHEGAFGICAFWEVEVLARQGRLEEAETRLAALVGYANDVGLFAEEIDPQSRRHLGNFPQAFTHVGLINAALALARAKAAEAPPGQGHAVGAGVSSALGTGSR